MLDNAATHRSLGTWTQERTIANISVVPVRGPDALYTQQSRSMPPNEVARDTIPRGFSSMNLRDKVYCGISKPLGPPARIAMMKITIFVCAFVVFGTHAAPAHSFGPPNLGNLHCNGNSDLIVIRGGKFTE